MPTISVQSSKGGVGKSTLSVNLCVAALADGLHPLLIDLDPQASASAWLETREAAGLSGIESAAANSATLRRTIDRAAGRLVVIDTPPHNGSVASTALAMSDLAVVPTRWGSFDLAALVETFGLIAAKKIPAVSIINMVRAGVPIEKEIYAFCQQHHAPVIGEVGDRVAFPYAVAAGQGVVEARTSDDKARLEIEAVWHAIRKQLKIKVSA